MRIRSTAVIALLLFAAVFLTHGLSRNATPFDSQWSVPMMLSLVRHGDANLDEYPVRVLGGLHGFHCVDAEYRVARPQPEIGCPASSHTYPSYPIGTAVVAMAPMLLMDMSLRLVGPGLEAVATTELTPVRRAFFRRDYLGSYTLVEVVLGSFFVAVTTVLLFLTARLYLPPWSACVLALLFAFGTSAWSTASRALYQHGPAMLMLSLALYLLSLSERRPSLAGWTSVPLVLACFIRPTIGIVLVLVGAYIFFHQRDQVLKWILLGMPVAVPFLLYNLSVYHTLLQPHYPIASFQVVTGSNLGKFLRVVAGHCISPSRGLFIFSPFLVFALPGMYWAFRGKWRTPLTYYLGAAVALHWLVISLYGGWTGGHAYGPRLFCDVIPILIFFLIPTFHRLLGGRRAVLKTVPLACLALISVFIHARGALDWDVFRWNVEPTNISFDPARVWDWKDPQFLRGLFDKQGESGVQ